MPKRSNYYRGLLERRLRQVAEAHTRYLDHNGGDYDFGLRKQAPALDLFAKLFRFDDDGLHDPSAEEWLELAYESLRSAEAFFNYYTVHSGQNRLVPFVADTVSAIIGAKDDIAYELGDPDAPDRIYDDLGDAELFVERALAHYNSWVRGEGIAADDPQVTAMNGHLAYALDHIRALMADGPDRAGLQGRSPEARYR